MKRLNPYSRLLKDIKEFCSNIQYRHTKPMWQYPKGKLNTGWNLGDLWERTQAAEQLGYDVIVKADDNGLTVIYKKKIPTIPYEWQ